MHTGSTGIGALLALALLSSAVSPAAASFTAPTPDRGDWVAIGELGEPRRGHSATLLPDGTVLVVGGVRGPGRPVLAAELVYPASGATRPAGVLPFGLSEHDALPLPDGRVLVAGGRGGHHLCAPYPPLVWDPATLTFLAVRGIEDAQGASATLLADGRVLLAGGGTSCSYEPQDGLMLSRRHDGSDIARIWDPATGEVTPTGPLAEARSYHEAVRLHDGRVLVAGGRSVEYRNTTGGVMGISTLEVFDPAIGTWQPAGRYRGFGIADVALLPDGRVAIAERIERPGLALWDPAVGDVVAGDGVPSPRDGVVAAVLADGRLMVVGGYRNAARGDRLLASAVLWDPASGQRRTIRYPTDGADTGYTATLLADGSVLVIGGIDKHGRGDRTIGTIEAWRP